MSELTKFKGLRGIGIILVVGDDCIGVIAPNLDALRGVVKSLVGEELKAYPENAIIIPDFQELEKK